MPLRRRVDCPECGAPLLRKPGGRCPSCGTAVAAYVQAARAREERIEKIVAVLGTALVLVVFALTAGVGLAEGVVMYGVAGAVMFHLARKTF